MIREAAALELAETLFEPFLKNGLISHMSVELAASIIRMAVHQDELEQQREIREMSADVRLKVM